MALVLPTHSLFAHAFADSIRDRYQTAVDFAHAFELAARSELRAITLPPGEKTATLDEPMPMGTIIAAGVPRRRKLAPLLFAALFALAIVGALAAVLFIYFEPVPGHRHDDRDDGGAARYAQRPAARARTRRGDRSDAAGLPRASARARGRARRHAAANPDRDRDRTNTYVRRPAHVRPIRDVLTSISV